MATDLSGMPRVDRVSGRPELEPHREALGPALLVSIVRRVIDRARARLLAQERTTVPTEDEVVREALREAESLQAGKAQEVLNATGVLVHTNLGRAPLGARATRKLARAAAGYSSIEMDLESGRRGRRGAFVETALASVSEAESALVVNNCAAAVLLLLSTVARGKAVIVSRGELVEIGGGFRVPDVMAESGARLVEVGTTNKTRIDDYARALDREQDVVAILRVHQGNFRQVGFVERPDLAELGALASSRGVPLLKDLGGGALVDLAEVGFEGEPLVTACVRAGCSAITFSTDKVLGGPQGGALVGRRDLVDRARKHPLYRALRLGRLPLLALEGTLESYLAGRAWEEIPALAMAKIPADTLMARVEGWVRVLAGKDIHARCVESTSEMGGGTLAGRSIPSYALELAPPPGRTADDVARALRIGPRPVVARVVEGAVRLEARTVPAAEDEALLAAIEAALR